MAGLKGKPILQIRKSIFLVLGMVVGGLAAAAQDKAVAMDPADSASPSSIFSYDSAFAGYRPAAGEAVSPDKAWRAANDEMQRLGGHAGHIKSSSDSSSAEQRKPDQPANHSIGHKGK